MEPKLRFKAFSDELSHHTLMDIIVEKPSNGIMNRQSDKVTAVKHINVIDMYTDDKIHVDELRYSEYGDTAVEKCNVEIGDIFLTRSSVKADGIAKSNILLDDGIYVYDDHLIRLKVDKNNYIPEFVNDYLASPRFRRQFIVRAKTTAFTTIGQGDVASCTGDFPSLPEQQKIAEFLSTIDTVIKKQKETVSAWEERKKGVMQKLFSQEVRFKADDGSEFPEWEEKKLGDFGVATGGTSIESEFVSEGKYKVINIGSYSMNNVYKDQGLRVNKTNKTENRILKANDLTMILNDKTQAGNIIGRVLLIDKDDTYVYNQRTERIEVDESSFKSEFLYQYLNADDIRSKIVKSSQGNTQIYVNWSSISNITYNIPSLAEQQRIADCLVSFDEVIEKQKATLAAWEELKKDLLQQMFV